MGDAGEILADVELEQEAVTAHERNVTQHGAMRTPPGLSTSHQLTSSAQGVF